MCHVFQVTYHVSYGKCHVKKKNNEKNSGASRWRISYQWGLSRLILLELQMVGLRYIKKIILLTFLDM